MSKKIKPKMLRGQQETNRKLKEVTKERIEVSKKLKEANKRIKMLECRSKENSKLISLSYRKIEKYVTQIFTLKSELDSEKARIK